MVFTSITFIFLFLPVVLLLNFLAGSRFKNVLLLFASLFFYAWGEKFFVLIMICSIINNYVFGLMIHKFREKKSTARYFLVSALVVNLGIFVFFKYANFLVDNFNMVLASISMTPVSLAPVHLPIGISFFTFQAMTYIVDIYREKVPAQKKIINVGLYISLFPQLIAGPIVRYHDIAKQLVKRSLNLSAFAYGCERFIFGFGKKILIANPLSEVADQVFLLSGADLTTGTAWLGIVCYTLQIYFDFSGYSDMAIGLGRMFGFTFPENFNYPYISGSIREFWRRWHIALSNWFRDYLYIPLGGNRKGLKQTYFNLLIVFFLCGLWHGASWNFVIWGLFHGLFLVIERMGLNKILKNLWQPLCHAYVLLTVMIAWVFFRTETLSEALNYFSAMFSISAGSSVYLYINSISLLSLIAGILFSTPLLPYLNGLFADMRDTPGSHSAKIAYAYPVMNSAFLYLILITSIMRLATGAHNPFIYFKF